MFSSISLRDFLTSSLRASIILMMMIFKSFSSASSALLCSGLVGVDSLDSGGVMLVFLLLGVFLYCRLPIASSSRCRWGLSLSLWYSPGGLRWVRGSMSVALGGSSSLGRLSTGRGLVMGSKILKAGTQNFP